MKRRLAVLSCLGGLLTLVSPSYAPAQSVADTVEAIQHARVTTRILFITAHPDDEWPSLLAYLARGRGADVALLTLTRGQGGQNAIGPEQGDQMGMVRTSELLAADKIYGVQQFFSRASDFGYSKSADETLRIWDHVALEDMVRVIRLFRPNIVINGWGGVHSGHGQHQASGILTPQAITQSADAKAFPEQIAEGLPPWQTPVTLEFARGDSPSPLRVSVDEISPLWGESYLEMGIEGRSQHRSQGTPAGSLSSFFRRPIDLVPAGASGTSGRITDAALAEPIASLASRFPPLHGELEPALANAEQAIRQAEKSALNLQWPDAAKSLASAGKAIVLAEKQISGSSSPDSAAAGWELAKVRERIDVALVDVMALHIEPRADRHELVAGESFSVNSVVVDKPRAGSVALQKPGLSLPAGWTIAKQETKGEATAFTVSIPPGAKPPVLPGDVVLPWPPPLVQAVYQASVDGYEFPVKVPAIAQQATTTEVVSYPLELLPAVSLTVEPRQIMLPEKDAHKPIELLARVRNHGTMAADVVTGLDVPLGWSVAPVEPIHFSGAGDALVRFVVTPPAHPATGAHTLRPFAKRGAQIFRESVEVLPSLPTRNWIEPADATVHVLDLIVPKPLRIGYVTAGEDPIPDALRQLGIEIHFLDEVALAFDDLRTFDAIVVGIRAYELRPDVARANARLLEYVSQGGTLVVQYEHTDVWNRLHPAPFPVDMPAQTARITDENSPVRFAVPASPLLNFPNKIGMDDFQGWLQERGLYFWGKFDSHYEGVLAMRDPGEEELLGGLVTAPVGKGVYIYTGLAFFRQLPTGVPGAYRLFVNLLSQSKAK